MKQKQKQHKQGNRIGRENKPYRNKEKDEKRHQSSHQSPLNILNSSTNLFTNK